jgi:hypothetical protein
VAGAIDLGLQDALMTLKKEGKVAASSVTASGSHSRKRKGGASDTLAFGASGGQPDYTDPPSPQEYDNSEGYKRRRLTTLNLLESYQGQEDAVSKVEGMDASVTAFLEDMKMKMDRQAQTIEMLTLEYNEVRLFCVFLRSMLIRHI